MAGVYSVANQNAASPLWSRVLTPGDGGATNLLVQLGEPVPAGLTTNFEAVLKAHEADGFRLLGSGVPVIVELIRRGLTRDLVVFSAAAFVLFGLITGLVYRNVRVVAGTLLSCLGACAATLLLIDALGIGVGLLTANIVTIVFVLTLSHTVFLTANWRRPAVAAGPDAASAVSEAVIQTIRPSAWCMLTTLLGFVSLRMASAEPCGNSAPQAVSGSSRSPSPWPAPL